MTKRKNTKPKEVKIPAHVRIGYQDFLITESKEPTHSDIALGYTRKDSAHIHLNHTNNKVCNVNTLIHETLHALIYTQGIPLSDDLEEQIVTAMANGLTQVIRDNPQYVHYILDQLEMI